MIFNSEHVSILKFLNYKIQSYQKDSDFTDSSKVFEPSIVCERIDDIPLLMAMLLKLDLQNAIDKYYTPHVNHEGLSYGWLLTIWIVYILNWLKLFTPKDSAG